MLRDPEKGLIGCATRAIAFTNNLYLKLILYSWCIWVATQKKVLCINLSGALYFLKVPQGSSSLTYRHLL